MGKRARHRSAMMSRIRQLPGVRHATRHALRASLVGWLAFTAVGWLVGSMALAIIAPLLLLPAIAVIGLRGQSVRSADSFDPLWLCGALFGFAYILVPVLMLVQPGPFISLPGYEDLPAGQFRLASLIASLALLAFLAGYRALQRPTRFTPRPPASVARCRGLGLTLFIVGTASVALAVHQAGAALSPTQLFSAGLRAAIVSHLTGHGYLTVGFTFLMLAPPVLVLWASRVRRLWTWSVTFALAIASILELGAITGSRLGVLVIAVSCAAVIHYRVRRLPFSFLLPAAVILAGLGILQAFLRHSAHLHSVLSPFATLSLTVDGFGQLVNALGRVHTYQWGRTLLEDLGLTYMPRALWPHKPLLFGVVRAQQAVMPGLFADTGNGVSTYPVGLVAEGYVNFAVFGAVGIAAIAGSAVRWLYNAFIRSNGDWQLLVMAWALGNVVSLMRGLATTALAVVVGGLVLSPLALTTSTFPGLLSKLRRT